MTTSLHGEHGHRPTRSSCLPIVSHLLSQGILGLDDQVVVGWTERGVTQVGLDLGQAIPLVEKLSCAGASEHVWVDVFRYPCLFCQGLWSALSLVDGDSSLFSICICWYLNKSLDLLLVQSRWAARRPDDVLPRSWSIRRTTPSRLYVAAVLATHTRSDLYPSQKLLLRVIGIRAYPISVAGQSFNWLISSPKRELLVWSGNCVSSIFQPRFRSDSPQPTAGYS